MSGSGPLRRPRAGLGGTPASGRPIYSLSEHFGVATEWGISSVKYDAETGGNILKRVTLAPELRLNPKYFARPVLRAYYTTSFAAGNAYGFQGEVWF